MKTVIQALASRIKAFNNCVRSGNETWKHNHSEAIGTICAKYLPHGSGFDAGCHIVPTSETKDQVIISTSFHHMDEVGGYDGWTEHVLVVTPTFDGINIDINGENRDDIYDYIQDVFYDALTQEINPEDT